MNKKAYIFIATGIIFLAIVVYFLVKPGSQKPTTYQNNNQPKLGDNSQTKDAGSLASKDGDTTKPLANSGNTSSETGSSVNASPPSKEPSPDVVVAMDLGSGSPEPKTVQAKQGDRVRITFTANIRDEVKIASYDIVTNVEPRRDSSIAFNADKVGEFAITLVKTNKIVGTLRVQ